MKKLIYTLFLSIILSAAWGQQLPYYTQFKQSNFLLNPAVAGTRKNIDLRIHYRNQWLKFPDAPQTQCISFNSRMLKGKLGAGGFLYKDITGPTSRLDYSFSLAYHLKLPDVEFSFGASGSMMQYELDGTKINLHHKNDPAINTTLLAREKIPEASAGFYIYNDRFNFGISALHLLQSKIEFYKGDTTKTGIVKLMPHFYVNLGYNYSANPDYLWEHSIIASYVAASPFMVDYNVRFHYKKVFITGLSVRLKDAIALHVGAVIDKHLQFCYSYDFITSPLRKFTSGSHELMLAYGIDLGSKRKSSRQFQRQKYDLL